MKLLSQLFIPGLLFSSILLAQETTATEPELTRALQFKYNQGMSFGAFNGNTISYKKMASGVTEHRYSLSINGRSYKHEMDRTDGQQYVDPDTLVENKLDDNENRTDLYLSAAYAKLKHRHTIDRVSLFYGGGPQLSYRYELSERDDVATRDTVFSTLDYANREVTLLAGIQGIIGWEWRVNNIISITAEYSSLLEFEIFYHGRESTVVYPGSVTNSASITGRRPSVELWNGTRIGVSLFF